MALLAARMARKIGLILVIAGGGSVLYAVYMVVHPILARRIGLVVFEPDLALFFTSQYQTRHKAAECIGKLSGKTRVISEASLESELSWGSSTAEEGDNRRLRGSRDSSHAGLPGLE